MGTIGNQIAAGQALTIANDSFNGDGSTTAFTLSQAVGSVNDIEVLVDNVQQSPYDSSYSVSGTTLTFSGAPATGTNNVYVIYNASKHITTQQVIPDDGSVHSSKIANLAVTHAKLHTDMDLSAKNVNPITMSTGTNKMQLAIQSTVSNRFAIRSTHTADYDNNPFIIDQPSGAGHQNDALVVTANGYVTQSKVPCFSAVCTNHAVNGDLVFNIANINRGNHYNTSNGRFTAPVTGAYGFMFYGMSSNSNTNYRARIYINGGSHSSGEHVGGVSYQMAGTYQQMILTTILQLNASDYVNIHWQPTSYGSMHESHNKFSGYLIG